MVIRATDTDNPATLVVDDARDIIIKTVLPERTDQAIAMLDCKNKMQIYFNICVSHNVTNLAKKLNRAALSYKKYSLEAKVQQTCHRRAGRGVAVKVSSHMQAPKKVDATSSRGARRSRES